MCLNRNNENGNLICRIDGTACPADRMSACPTWISQKPKPARNFGDEIDSIKIRIDRLESVGGVSKKEIVEEPDSDDDDIVLPIVDNPRLAKRKLIRACFAYLCILLTNMVALFIVGGVITPVPTPIIVAVLISDVIGVFLPYLAWLGGVDNPKPSPLIRKARC